MWILHFVYIGHEFITWKIDPRSSRMKTTHSEWFEPRSGGFWVTLLNLTQVGKGFPTWDLTVYQVVFYTAVCSKYAAVLGETSRNVSIPFLWGSVA